MSVTDINYTLETTDKATDKDQLLVTSDILGYYNLYLHINTYAQMQIATKN